MKVCETILRYDSLITAAVAAEPHASLAWGSVAAFLPILSTTLSQTDDALNNLSAISALLVRFRAIEVIYDLSEHPEEKFAASKYIQDLHGQLRTQTIDMYTRILEYQIELIGHYSRNQFQRVVKDIAVPSQGIGIFSAIQKNEADANNTLRILDSGAIAGMDRQLSLLGEDIQKVRDMILKVNEAVLDVAQNEFIRQLPWATCAGFNEGLGGMVPPSCHENTRRDILEIIRCWGEDGGGEQKCIFWLSGMAGTGKSTIARTVARIFHGNAHLGASFFFSKGQEDRTNSERFFSTLAHDLATKVPGFDACLYQAVPKHEDMRTKSLKDQWEFLILNPLQSLGSRLLVPVQLVVVIDALDECKGTEAVPHIVSLLLEANSLQRIRLKILVTSRNEKHIVQSLDGNPDVTHLSLEEGVGARNIEHDISVYIRHELDRIAQSARLKELEGWPLSKKLQVWPKENQTQELVRWSGKLFIAAATACKFLDDTDFPIDRLSRFLEAKRTTGSGTDALDDMYRHLLRSASSERDEDELIRLFPIVVGAILVSKEPISVFDMKRLLELEVGQITFILGRLKSVLIVPHDVTAPVRLFHLSFRDFLVDEKRCLDKNLLIDERKANARSFQNCLKHISSRLKKDMCGLHQPGTLFSEIDQNRVTQYIPHVVQYACQYWASHLKDAGPSSSETGMWIEASGFLKEHLLHWIEALALLERVDDAVNATAILKNLALISSGSVEYGLDCLVHEQAEYRPSSLYR
ncbi:uncharacterized protein BO97DRAFT_58145 [Aspergillus homomorphus CBS 101889]|uniref:NACHT domain-containing protein n=1 Tax=Aspergillus homomorphus (strain CBS 101889) TaxID=1450537 RepID=A0A395HYG7_ASPHC|nr:hypothetical protein BO97DRAFT_58145 [Aspergillus homomorphus CBS 101889]RAL12495.1 hypothetical protein BO97DRAFT_58145 [Aspergillus homomorphus CBS 101889]